MRFYLTEAGPDVALRFIDNAESAFHRVKIICQAIAAFLTHHQPSREKAFGLWRDQPEDGLRYQDKTRAEWRD